MSEDWQTLPGFRVYHETQTFELSLRIGLGKSVTLGIRFGLLSLGVSGTLPATEVLHTGIGEADLLGSMTVKYGKIFFWDSLDHILSAAQGKLIEKAPGVTP